MKTYVQNLETLNSKLKFKTYKNFVSLPAPDPADVPAMSELPELGSSVSMLVRLLLRPCKQKNAKYVIDYKPN